MVQVAPFDDRKCGIFMLMNGFWRCRNYCGESFLCGSKGQRWSVWKVALKSYNTAGSKSSRLPKRGFFKFQVTLGPSHAPFEPISEPTVNYVLNIYIPINTLVNNYLLSPSVIHSSTS